MLSSAVVMYPVVHQPVDDLCRIWLATDMCLSVSQPVGDVRIVISF